MPSHSRCPLPLCQAAHRQFCGSSEHPEWSGSAWKQLTVQLLPICWTHQSNPRPHTSPNQQIFAPLTSHQCPEKIKIFFILKWWNSLVLVISWYFVQINRLTNNFTHQHLLSFKTKLRQEKWCMPVTLALGERGRVTVSASPTWAHRSYVKESLTWAT